LDPIDGDTADRNHRQFTGGGDDLLQSRQPQRRSPGM
jgi:hypothetical protein